MRYVIGIDSGGTKYLVKACDLNGNEIAEFVGLPAPHYRFTKDEIIKRINYNVDNCLLKFNGQRDQCAYLVCGTTGLDSEEDYKIIEEIYNGLGGFNCPIICVNDAEIVLYAGTDGVGAVVIAGTGSVAFGRNSKGKTSRSGGWPPIIFGDAGSGTWISYKALHHLTLVFDDIVQGSEFSEMLMDCLNIKARKDLLNICVKLEKMEWKDPGLSEIVNKAAGKGNKHAITILQDAADHTFNLANSVVRKLELNKEPVFKVMVWGSAIVESPIHFNSFKNKFANKYENVEVLIPDVDAAVGACRLGLQKLRQTSR